MNPVASTIDDCIDITLIGFGILGLLYVALGLWWAILIGSCISLFYGLTRELM
jgi:hypothetical protein